MHIRLAWLAVPSALVFVACGASSPAVTDTTTPTATASAEATPTLDETLLEVEERVEAIRGLRNNVAFDVEFIDQDTLESLADQLDAGADTGPLMTALGLAGPRRDGGAAIEGGAFVDSPPTIYVVGDPSDGLDEREISVYVHEYIHLLQSAAFAVPTHDPSDVDGTFAQLALREGDAVRVEQAYQRRYLNTVRADLELPLGELTGDRFDSATTLFVFGGGGGLIDALGGAGAPGVDAAFRVAFTSEQVIHPEKFASAEVDLPPPETPLLARLGFTADEIVDRAYLGEFFYLSWLTALQSDTAFSGASGWGGDVALVLNEDDRPVTVLRIEWDQPDSDIPEFETALASGLDHAAEFERLPAGGDGIDAWRGPGGVASFGSDALGTTVIVAPTQERAAELVMLAVVG